MRQPLFSTLKRVEKSFHPAVGSHSVSTWSEFALVRVQWPSGKVTEHLDRSEYVNGQVQWAGASYGVDDTKRLLANFGVDSSVFS